MSISTYPEARGTNYSGQGAFSDPGHNYWNALVRNGTSPAATASDGTTATAVTFTEADTFTFNGGNTPGIALFKPYDGNATSPPAAPPTPLTLTLNNVPTGTYSLYLYGINGGYANRGTTFTVNGVSQSTVNTTSSSFIQGNNYVLFTGLSPVNGAISATYTAYAGTGVQTSGNQEGDFNGLQLVQTPEPASIGLLGLGALGLLARRRRSA